MKIIHGNALTELRKLDTGSVHCVVTSPPYWGLRDYGVKGQYGLEKTPEEYVAKTVEVFREVRRVLRDDGTLWLNLGDSYYNYRPGVGQALVKQSVSNTGQDLPRECPRRANIIDGLKEKDLVGIPWRVAFALQADGWYLRSDIIWAKPNPMPESVIDRPTKSHEYIFLLSKSAKYYYDIDAVREPYKTQSLKRLKSGWDGNKKRDWPGTGHNNFDKYMGKSDEEIESLAGRNLRTVWTIATQPYKEAHLATFPEKLVEPCIKAGCPIDGVVLDPFAGSGTTLLVAEKLGRESIGIEIKKEYCDLIEKRIRAERDQIKITGIA